MLDTILELSKKLITYRTDPGKVLALNDALDCVKSYFSEGFTVEHFERNGSKSILVYTAKKRPTRFRVILNGHLDVIPGKDFQYVPRVQGDRLYGVGSMDMKSNVACLAMAFKEMAPRMNELVALQIVTDEETGGFDGTKHQVEQGVRADFVVAGETTNFNIAHKAKGIDWIKITAKGITAHGAYPWRGDNAIWKMIRFLDEFGHKYPHMKNEEWKTSFNLARIETNNMSFNKVPDDCTVWFDIRYIPEDKQTLLKELEPILPDDFTCEVVVHEQGLFTDKNNSYLRSLQQVVEKITGKTSLLYGANGSSDARHYTEYDCPGVEFGPVGGGIGTDDEWVSISSLQTYYKVLIGFLAKVDLL